MCRWTRIRAARQTASLPHSAARENTAHNADPAGPWATQGLQRKKRNKTPWKNPRAPDGNPVRRGALHGSVLPPQQEDKGLQRLRVRFSSLFFLFSLFIFLSRFPFGCVCFWDAVSKASSEFQPPAGPKQAYRGLAFQTDRLPPPFHTPPP